LKAIHKRLFSDVYEWAGQIRQVDITRGNTKFAHANVIESAAKSIFTQLAGENCLCDLDLDEFSRRAGYYLGEINVLHPFRDGNGRAQREFISQLADKAGHHISWSNMSREEMTLASIEAYNGNSGRMAVLIRKNLFERAAG
jgi:cell filamentation protein